MNYLIIKQLDKNLYFHPNYYFIDNKVISKRNKIIKSHKSGRHLYYRLQSISYSENILNEWYNEWINLGKPKLNFLGKNKKTCLSCNKELDRKYFKTNKHTVCNDCLIKVKGIDIDDDYEIVNDFLLTLKAKKWLATPQDIFRLIDAVSRYCPNKDLGKPMSDEYGNYLLKMVIRGHLKKKMILVK